MMSLVKKNIQYTILAKSLSTVKQDNHCSRKHGRFGMGCLSTKTVYVDSYHFVDLYDGSYKIHIREAHSIKKNSKMANDLDRIRHPVHDSESNQGKCKIGRASCRERV